MGFLDSLLGSGTTQTSSVSLSPASSQEQLGGKITEEQLKQLQALVAAGPGKESVNASNSANQSLADLLKSFSQGNFLPNAQDQANAQQFTNASFAPQQESLKQLFSDQTTEANRLAAQLGRDINDPVLRAKLATGQAREQALLDSQKTAFSAQTAQNMPLQRLGFTSDLANLQSSLANQAFSNRQTLLNLGNTVQQQGQNFRLQTATRTTNQNTDNGILGAVGGIAGLAGGFGQIGSGVMALSKLFGSGGAAAPTNNGAFLNSSLPKINGGLQAGVI